MKLIMDYTGHQGYGADQVEGITLYDLATAVKEALDDYGDDALVCLHETNNRGANYGTLNDAWDLFRPAEEDD